MGSGLGPGAPALEHAARCMQPTESYRADMSDFDRQGPPSGPDLPSSGVLWAGDARSGETDAGVPQAAPPRHPYGRTPGL